MDNRPEELFRDPNFKNEREPSDGADNPDKNISPEDYMIN